MVEHPTAKMGFFKNLEREEMDSKNLKREMKKGGRILMLLNP